MSADSKDAIAQRKREDMAIATDLILRSVPAIDALVAALEGAGGSRRLVGALRAELARRRGKSSRAKD